MRKFRHNKTGKEYELVQEHLLFKDLFSKTISGELYKWRKESNLILYKALYDNPDGPYFVRHVDDFFKNFTEIK